MRFMNFQSTKKSMDGLMPHRRAGCDVGCDGYARQAHWHLRIASFMRATDNGQNANFS